MKVPYKSHNFTEDKPLKIVVRSLPFNTDAEAVRMELENYNFKVKSVVQMTIGCKDNKRISPQFYAQIHGTPDFERIYAMKYFFNADVIVRKYRGRKGANHCHNCQGFSTLLKFAPCPHPPPLCQMRQ